MTPDANEKLTKMGQRIRRKKTDKFIVAAVQCSTLGRKSRS